MMVCLELVLIETTSVTCSGKLRMRSPLGARYLEIAGPDEIRPHALVLLAIWFQEGVL
jgi:hypothetical protein